MHRAESYKGRSKGKCPTSTLLRSEPVDEASSAHSSKPSSAPKLEDGEVMLKDLLWTTEQLNQTTTKRFISTSESALRDIFQMATQLHGRLEV